MQREQRAGQGQESESPPASTQRLVRASRIASSDTHTGVSPDASKVEE